MLRFWIVALLPAPLSSLLENENKKVRSKDPGHIGPRAFMRSFPGRMLQNSLASFESVTIGISFHSQHSLLCSYNPVANAADCYFFPRYTT